MTMTGAQELAVPSAARLQRPRWRDARLVIGVVLVLSSAVLGSLVVARAADRVPVYAAGRPLVPGQRLSQADLTPVRVQLGAQAAGYLSARRALGRGRVVPRDVRPGELVPAASVGSQAQVTVQPVTVSVEPGSA